MSVLARAIKNVLPATGTATSIPWGGNSTPGAYLSTTRAYTGNEIVYAALNLLASSAAEPHIVGRRMRRNRREVRSERRMLNAMGLHNRAGQRIVDAVLVRNKFFEEVEEHPLINLLNNPNPYMSRGVIWSLVVIYYYLAGNAYLYKARAETGLLQGAVTELWPLPPERMRVIPGDMSQGEPFVKGYEYRVGNQTQVFPAEDVMHFKTRNPMNPYYGLPPLTAIMERVAIDNYMRTFLRTFYEKGGSGPGAILSTTQKLQQADKDDIRDRFKTLFGGVSGMHETLILDNGESTYTQMGLARGLRDALPKEIDAVNEARIAMAFGIPGSILGLLIGYESSSYANKRQDWQVLWDVVMTPLLSDFDDVLNLSMVPEFAGIDEVFFDLSDIRALQEDVDALHERARSNVQAGIWTHDFARTVTGVDAAAPDDEIYLLPLGVQPVKSKDLANISPPDERETTPGGAGPPTQEPPEDAPPQNRVGRPRLEDDIIARAVYEDAMAFKTANPSMTWEQVAANKGLSRQTLHRYRQTFD